VSDSQKRVVFGVVAVLVVVGVGVGAYFIGKSAADASGAKADGVQQGEANVRAEYQPGQPAYQAIYAKGYAAGRGKGIATGDVKGYDRGMAIGLEKGRSQGEAQGEQQGEAQGERSGERTGAQTALGNMPGWTNGNYYVVRIARGQGPVPFTVAERKAMQPNESYHICTYNPDLICSEKIPPKSN
jgi:hypothetical protein